MEAIHQNYFDKKGQVFCKKQNKLISSMSPCDTCDYCVGCLQGDGVECLWQDNINQPIIRVEDPTYELMRVSKLIDAGIIKKG